jgi:pSer/pThr/pTyr-binding forkhead associated (FHA) protein
MDSKDKKNKDNQQPELSHSEQPEERKPTTDKSQLPSATTQSVADNLARIRNELMEQGEQSKSSITLKVLGVDIPITFHAQRLVTIGRVDPETNEHAALNLSGLSLNTAGISRKHLQLVYSNEQWYVEDMGSRNGTWLNNKLVTAFQRYKLQDGDQLRLASVSITIVTQVHDAQREKPKVTSALPETLKLTTPAIIKNQQGLSRKYITHDLMPYLQAVIEMMQHVDRAKKRSQREISIVSIQFSYPTITVQLSCSHDVLHFMSRLQSLVMPIPETDSLVMETTQPITMMSESTPTSEDQSIEIAQQFAEEHFPLITPDQSLTYQRLLAPLLRVCIESDIEVDM